MLSVVFITAIIVLASPQLSDHDFVFTTYNNGTGFPDNGGWSITYISLVGVLMSLYGLSGYESGATMSEETSNASIAAPRGMVEAVIASAVTGMVFILGLLYACQGDIERVLSGPTDQAVVNIFTMTFSDHQNTQGSHTGALILTFVLGLNIFLAGFSHMTVTTRITYALVRDKALPGSDWMNKLNHETKNPDRVLVVVLILDAALCLLPLISTTAFTAITQITTIGYQLSYGLPIALRLYQQISPSMRSSVKVGPFNLGRFSPFCAALALVWLVVTSVVLFFP